MAKRWASSLSGNKPNRKDLQVAKNTKSRMSSVDLRALGKHPYMAKRIK
jgi:hypothetical protein